ncbi:MAG: chorismate synthase [Bacteroidota bacterium]|nr:chorismate synthase [Bacteroidota bacterium]
MAGNSFGKALVLITFGESHGSATGGVLDGFPSGIFIDTAFIQRELDRRKPGCYSFSSQRQEDDIVEILSGLFSGKTTGAPIAFLIRNRDARPEDYLNLKDIFRPSHADFTYEQKYGLRDYRGGGRASARETAARVAAGAFAKILLQQTGISVTAYTSLIGNIGLPKNYVWNPDKDYVLPETGCPDPATSENMLQLLEQLREEGDSTGGIVTCRITGVPAGLGEPVFDKLQADLAKGMMSINAAKAFEYGSGFDGCSRKGSEENDPFIFREGKILTETNHSGGIQGGISNGNEIYFQVGFKPAASIAKNQTTVNRKGEEVLLSVKGRHDVCVVPRAVPVVEAMAAFVIADHWLRFRQVPADSGNATTQAPR